MNAALRIFTWLLALALVALPVVAVVNGWIGADRWPLTKLRVASDAKHVDDAELQKVLAPFAKQGFFAVRSYYPMYLRHDIIPRRRKKERPVRDALFKGFHTLTRRRRT